MTVTARTIIIGFTGTRKGMTDSQRDAVKRLIQRFIERYVSHTCLGLHGDCIGADVDFHDICRGFGLGVIKRPSTWSATVAGTDAQQVDEPKRPFTRNRDIVHEATCLIGCPPNFEQFRGSGTWYTIGYARQCDKPIFVVLPDGSIGQ